MILEFGKCDSIHHEERLTHIDAPRPSRHRPVATHRTTPAVDRPTSKMYTAVCALAATVVLSGTGADAAQLPDASSLASFTYIPFTNGGYSGTIPTEYGTLR